MATHGLDDVDIFIEMISNSMVYEMDTTVQRPSLFVMSGIYGIIYVSKESGY